MKAELEVEAKAVEVDLLALVHRAWQEHACEAVSQKFCAEAKGYG